LTTKITQEDIASQIRGKMLSSAAGLEKLSFTRQVFCQYLVEEDAKFTVVPTTAEFKEQFALCGDIQSKYMKRLTEVPQTSVWPIEVSNGVVAVVEGFYEKKGFGFVKAHSFDDSAFIHSSTLEAFGIETIHDGDELLCDLSRNEKGLFVSKIHDFNIHASQQHLVKITRLFRDRGYGFVTVEDLGVDAFFHYSLFVIDIHDKLVDEMSFLAEVVAGQDGKWQVRRAIDLPRLVTLQ
jgi:cold shock CspA family protein